MKTEELRGTVDYIVYSSSDDVFSVFRLKEKDGGNTVTAAGQVGVPAVGATVTLRGCWTKHPRFGMQFKAESMVEDRPERAEDILQYLADGHVDGIGPALAKRIVDRFGSKTLSIMDDNLEALREVPGIGAKKLETIRASYAEGAALRHMVLFLQSAGVPTRFAKAIQKAYGDNAEQVLQKEPYRMVQEISGLGFRMADKIALAEGVAREDEERLIRGVLYVISQYSMDGHCCVPAGAACRRAAELLGVDETLVIQAARGAVDVEEIPSILYGEGTFLYTPLLYEAETASVHQIHRLMHAKYLGSAKLAIESFEKKQKLELAQEQRDAVEKAMDSGVMIITGGPGTGKTTLIRAILEAAGQYGLKVRLMAPTGRAAKRLSITSGRNADTIHKALEAEMHGDRTFFGRNESEPLKEDLIIVDEASMLDMVLFYRLLCALKEGARLILVGDIDQLPPVGPGSPLKDLIAWGEVPVVRLQHIFRQEEGSGIITNATRIREGTVPIPDERGEFQMITVSSEAEAYFKVMELVKDSHYEEEKHLGNIQVLSPMYKGVCGVDNLNGAIQEYVQQTEHIHGFCRGDKVMQKKNDYEKGVYNGDIGIVWAVTDRKVSVHFPEKEVVYEGDEKNDLQLAYAVTVHKSQGSEYDTVFFVLLPSQWIMLQRNLLYTGVTRASRKTVLITTKQAVETAVRTYKTQGRCTLFLPLLSGEAQP